MFTHRLQRFTEQYSVLGGHLYVYSAPGPISHGLVEVVSVGLFPHSGVVTYRPGWPAQVLIANQCCFSPSATPTREIYLLERGLRTPRRAIATLLPDLIACVSLSLSYHLITVSAAFRTRGQCLLTLWGDPPGLAAWWLWVFIEFDVTGANF